MVDARDSKSRGPRGCEGSSPSSGTTFVANHSRNPLFISLTWPFPTCTVSFSWKPGQLLDALREAPIVLVVVSLEDLVRLDDPAHRLIDPCETTERSAYAIATTESSQESDQFARRFTHGSTTLNDSGACSARPLMAAGIDGVSRLAGRSASARPRSAPALAVSAPGIRLRHIRSSLLSFARPPPGVSPSPARSVVSCDFGSALGSIEN